MTDLLVVSHRVDALVLAYRVEWDGAFLAEVEKRSAVARKHGRASLVWKGRVPVGEKKDVMLVPPPWSGEAYAYEAVQAIERPIVVGEIGWSEVRSAFHITNEPYFRLLVRKHAPGAIEIPQPDGSVKEEPGWTAEVVWYAQRLAEWGLARCLRESRALVWTLGDVFEERLRRIDLCADVAGWSIGVEDAERILKRSRASKAIASDATELDDVGRPARPKRLGDLAGPVSHEAGKVAARKVCGISVGAGGALMSRVYDKRVELAYDQRGERRAAEEERWAAGGWDGKAPVTRVEFQVRGEAIKELGIRNPEACLLPVLERGKKGVRAVAQRVAHDGDGCVLGLVEMLPRLWATLLDWMRIVDPVKERIELPRDPKTGRRRYKYRFKDDPRWALLRTIRFGDAAAVSPIKRCRLRGVATEAQALGVCLAQAAREGELDAFEDADLEVATSYGDDAEEHLRKTVGTLCRDQADRIVRWLLDRYGDPKSAAAHLAIRARAKRSRFYDWKGVAHAIHTLAGRTGPPLDLGTNCGARVDARRSQSAGGSLPLRAPPLADAE